MAETTAYTVYYSSRTKPDGSMWCPGCVLAEEPLKKIFNQVDGPRAEIVYVGDRTTWKDPNCIFRQAPLKLRSIPTVLKFVDGKPVDMIEEDGILNAEEIKKFVGL